MPTPRFKPLYPRPGSVSCFGHQRGESSTSPPALRFRERPPNRLHKFPDKAARGKNKQTKNTRRGHGRLYNRNQRL